MHANEPEMADKWEKEKKDEAAERDYKDEYKKFQSSTNRKKMLKKAMPTVSSKYASYSYEDLTPELRKNLLTLLKSLIFL